MMGVYIFENSEFVLRIWEITSFPVSGSGVSSTPTPTATPTTTATATPTTTPTATAIPRGRSF